MGFIDGFTSDGAVEMKHTEYYSLMKEAAKAELLGNAVKAEVPGFYIQAMITGEKPDFLNELEAEEEDTGFHSEYEQITGAVSIFTNASRVISISSNCKLRTRAVCPIFCDFLILLIFWPIVFPVSSFILTCNIAAPLSGLISVLFSLFYGGRMIQWD